MKKIIAIIISLMICLLGTVPAMAAGSVVEYNNAREFVFNPESGDLFQNFKSVMPGDILEQQIVIQNTKEHYPITMYLKAEIDDEYKDFLSNIDLSVYYSKTENGEKTLLQSGSASEEGLLAVDTRLGSYLPNEMGYITVSIYVHPEMDNEYKSCIGNIKWIFTAEEGERIPDGMISGQDSPQTGIDFIIGFAAIATVIVAVVILIVVNKKKKDEKSEEVSDKSET